MEFNLEDRTFLFAKTVRQLIKQLPKTIANVEDSKQVIRSSGSIGANYIEANEALSKKDFLMRVKISRKEAKETIYWLRLLDCPSEFHNKQNELLNEARELTNIFGAIVRKTEK